MNLYQFPLLHESAGRVVSASKLRDGGHVRVDTNEDGSGLLLIAETSVPELEHLD